MKNVLISCSLLILSMLNGCSQASGGDNTAGDLRAIDHVGGRGINGFSVNGSHVPGLGGGYCCIMLPEKWMPDLKARVEWEVDPHSAPPFPGYKDREKFNVWKSTVESSFQRHSAIVDIPQYGKERCGLTVHFLTCNQVKVTTACSGYGTPNYPVKEPLNMKEPSTCPVK